MALAKDKPVDSKDKVMSSKAKFFCDPQASPPDLGKRWGNSGNSVRLYFGGSKITADGDWSHEIKTRLLLGRKVMTNLDSILKSRDITLPKTSV